MLKIKDNVDLKILEDYGFYQTKDHYDNKIWRKRGHFQTTKNGRIIPLNGGGIQRFDIIYDLIKADLVEKVGN